MAANFIKTWVYINEVLDRYHVKSLTFTFTKNEKLMTMWLKSTKVDERGLLAYKLK